MTLAVVEVVQDGGWILASFDQTAAGTDDILADPGDGLGIQIKDFVLAITVTGTVNLKSGTSTITGVLPLLAGTPLYLNRFDIAPSEKFSVVSATGAVKGQFKYKVR